jgi:serine/threonine protein phosphatase PrpC
MIHHFTCSEVGGHLQSEDAFAVRPHPRDAGCLLCVLADGQGGRAGGGIAARVACEKCIEAASQCPVEQLLLPWAWTTFLRTVDQVVADISEAGFTTLVAFCVTDIRVCGASNGDSAAVVVSPNQSPTILTERQHKNPPVGSSSAVFVPFAATLARPWKVLAMSDGVWKYVGLDQVIRSASTLEGEALVDDLRERARIRPGKGFQDDFTVVVLQSGEDERLRPGEPGP